uniref:Uncharacterized protein n=1 Tax=Sphaerodactylus townsendi TaxID=933632 RepID=A0ACB8FGA4_9SAUR
MLAVKLIKTMGQNKHIAIADEKGMTFIYKAKARIRTHILDPYREAATQTHHLDFCPPLKATTMFIGNVVWLVVTRIVTKSRKVSLSRSVHAKRRSGAAVSPPSDNS